MTMPQASRLAEASTPLEVRFGTSRPQRRVTIFFRFILVIPQALVVGVLGYAVYFVMILGWFAALFTGRLPGGFAKFITGWIRWATRVGAYGYLMTDVYPPFSLDPDPNYPVDVAVTTGRLNRAAVFFRIILVVPAYVIYTVLAWGWAVLSFFFWIITLVTGQMPDSIFGATAAVLRYVARTLAYFSMVTSVYPGGVLGDTGPDGHRVDAPVSGTPDALMVAGTALPPQASAWNAGMDGASAQVPPPLPPPPPMGATPPPLPPPPMQPAPVGAAPSVSDVPPPAGAGSGVPVTTPAPEAAPGADGASPTPPPTRYLMRLLASMPMVFAF